MKRIYLGVIALTLIGCGVTTTTTTKTTTTTTTSEGFCYGLMEQSVREGENAFLSPASAAMALRMLEAGAAGETLDELQRVVPEVSVDTTEQLQTASALWINPNLEVKPAYLAANASAEVYREPITVDRVNQWASDRTNGRITEILQDPLPLIQMILTNALYFKAEWAEPFQVRNTRKEPFYGWHQESEVEMMHQTNHFLYIENKRLQAVRLYYSAPYCMDIILPKKGVGLEDGIKDAYSLEFSGEEKKVRLGLPKVKLEYEKQLNDYLKAMGLKTCFTERADFSRLSDTPIFVDFVKQNTYLQIDEEGTEAAAVTSIGLAKMAYRPEQEKTYEMIVNRPYIVLIKEIRSGQVLFYGVFADL